jgi:hypothetical protein
MTHEETLVALAIVTILVIIAIGYWTHLDLRRLMQILLHRC